MTTIAWDGATLAADSQEADDSIEQHACRKLYRVKGMLVGTAGDTEEIHEALEWLRGGEVYEDRPKGLEDIALLIVRANGKAYEYGKRLVPVPSAGKTAIGTGRAAALGAMLAGADAARAVSIASRIDPNSGGPVRRMSLASLKRHYSVDGVKRRKRATRAGR